MSEHQGEQQATDDAAGVHTEETTTTHREETPVQPAGDDATDGDK